MALITEHQICVECERGEKHLRTFICNVKYNYVPWRNSFYLILTNKLLAAWKCVTATMKCCLTLTHLFPWSRTAGTKTSSYPVLHEGNFFFSFSSPWQTDHPINELTSEQHRLNIQLLMLTFTSASVKLGHLLMCVMLHNQLCQPEKVRHCYVCGMWDLQV